MAEFPDLGRHCGVSICKQLDFLPISCDACRKTYCREHFSYEAHSCEVGKAKNVQVPVCPLCSQPVPTPKGQLPDVLVNEHIQNNCAKYTKQRIFKNQCTVSGCKKKELVPVTCKSCGSNFCLRHRHEQDHGCKGGRPMSNAALAALSRQKQQACGQQAQQTAQMIAADEALARQLAAEGGANLSPEELDRRLAEQLQLEENQNRRPVTGQQSTNSNCVLS